VEVIEEFFGLLPTGNTQGMFAKLIDELMGLGGFAADWLRRNEGDRLTLTLDDKVLFLEGYQR